MVNKQTDFIEELKSLVAKAKECDKECKAFAAFSHKYEFNPVVTMAEIRAFEKKYNLKLPENYARVLTEVGNGGAGPDYGLYSLIEVENINEHWLRSYDEILLDKNKKAIKSEWIEMCRLANLNDSERYNEMLDRMLNGGLVIGTQGCSMYNVVMCKGKHYGKIAIVDDGFIEECAPYMSDQTFEDWMLDYFREIVEKYSE
jgi:hypothetical protein